MFQLEPNTGGALGIDDQHSLATMATGVSNATPEMSQAAASTSFLVNAIKDDNAITVTSGVTTATAFSSPQNSTESNHSATPKLATARPHSLGGGQITKQHQPGSMDTHYHNGEDDNAKPAVDNLSQQNNLQPLQEDLGNEAMLDRSNEEGDQLDLSARLKIASIDSPLRNALGVLVIKDQTNVSN